MNLKKYLIAFQINSGIATSKTRNRQIVIPIGSSISIKTTMPIAVTVSTSSSI
jgi:hypothetical protein